MKKTKIIVPAIAALVLGLGAAVSSTVAWFTAGAATTISAYNADTEGLSTKAGAINMGSFTVEAVAQANLAAVELTDTTGKSYVFTGSEAVGQDGTGKVEVPVNDGVRTVDVKLKVTYNSIAGEAAKTAAEIKTIWAATIGAKSIGILGQSDAKVRFLASAAPANAAAWEGTVGTTGVTYSVSNSNLLALEFAACAGNGASAASTSNADAASDFFVAITGDNVKVEEASNHTLTFTPQTAA